MNSLGEGVAELLLQSLEEFRDDQQLWVGILTAGEKAFCVGADLKSWAQASREGPPIPGGGQASSTTSWHDLTYKFQLWKPMITAINGYALGGGLELALLCDIRIAAEHTRFGMPEVTWGFVPGGGGIQRLTRILHRCHAAEILLTRQHVDAQEAYRMGLVNRAVPLNRLAPTAMEWAETLCQVAPLSVKAIKEAMISDYSMTLEDALEFGKTTDQFSSYL